MTNPTTYSPTATKTIAAAVAAQLAAGRKSMDAAFILMQQGANRRKLRTLPADDAAACAMFEAFVLKAYYTPKLVTPNGMPVACRLLVQAVDTDSRSWALYPSGRMAVTDADTGRCKIYNSPSRAMGRETGLKGDRSYQCFVFQGEDGEWDVIDQLRNVAPKGKRGFVGHQGPAAVQAFDNAEGTA